MGQSPQFFPEIKDWNDYLDNNNATFFRLNSFIRNCCGGVSSCGTNGTWQLTDPREDHTKDYRFCNNVANFKTDAEAAADKQEDANVNTCSVTEKNNKMCELWELQLGEKAVDNAEANRDQTHVVERQVFAESCKVEDTASSLHQVLKGHHSQFVNQRLAYGLAKNPMDYLAAVQRWAEG